MASSALEKLRKATEAARLQPGQTCSVCAQPKNVRDMVRTLRSEAYPISAIATGLKDAFGIVLPAPRLRHCLREHKW